MSARNAKLTRQYIENWYGRLPTARNPISRQLNGCSPRTGRIPTPVCPSVSSHTAIKVRRTSGTIKYCTCNDCGVEWQHEFDPDQASPEPGRKTIEDLEDDVALLKQRRDWKEQLDRLPEIDQQRADLTKKLEASQERLNKAIETHRELSDMLQPQSL